MRDTFVRQLVQCMRENEKLIFITADLGFKAFDPILEAFPDRFLNVGVAEQSMTSVAAGLALEGYSVFTYSIANFSTLRCLEQIRNDVCYHDLNVNVVSNGGGFSYGPLGMSHHATEDLSILRALPGIDVIAPGDAWEVEQATQALIQSSQQAGYLRLDKTKAEPPLTTEVPFEIGKARELISGQDLTLIASGGILREALRAAEQLMTHGLRARVLSMHTLKPIDEAAILRSARETGGIITLEENSLRGGLGSAVAEVCMSQGCYPEKFLMLGIPDEYCATVGDQDFLRKRYGLDADSVVQRVLNLLRVAEPVVLDSIA